MFVKLGARHHNDIAPSCTYRTKPGESYLHIVGLPFDTTPGTIKEFLHPVDIDDDSIQIVQNSRGQCNNNAFVKV